VVICFPPLICKISRRTAGRRTGIAVPVIINYSRNEKKFPYKLNFCYNGDNDTVPEEESAGIAVKNIRRQIIMRCIGIIGAMDDEVAGLKEYMQDVKVTSRASMDFYEGILEGRRAVVVRSGIGKVNAAVCAQILVDEFQAEVIINTGIAGSLNNEINIGDIVVSTDLIHH